MRRLVALAVVVGFGIIFLQLASLSHEGYADNATPKGAEEANLVLEQGKSAVTEQNLPEGDDKAVQTGMSVLPDLDEAPRIVFENPEHDFGTIYVGEKVGHFFKFENRGKGDLTIKKVKTSCGCTAAATSKESIAPGGTGEVKATFSSGQNPGKAKKKITVTTNDPVTPDTNLYVTVNVIKEIVTNPQWLNLGNITKGAAGTKAVEISPGIDGFNLEVTGVEADNPNIIATYKKHENGKNYVVDVVIKGDAPMGMLRGQITVHTNGTKQQKITIPYNANITGDVIVSRPVLSYGVVPHGKELVRKLFVTLRNKDVDIKNVEITTTFLSANLQPRANPDVPYREVEVKLKDDAPMGKINGSIKIHTNSELQPVIEIPVYGEVRELAAKKN